MALASSRQPEARPLLWRLKDLQRYTIGAADGDIGGVETVYFDDQAWTVRYLVVDTGGWLSGKKVLISPRSVERLDSNQARVGTNLTREQVEKSPHIDTQKPVSRQYETTYFDYYGFPDYWTGPYRWGLDPYPLVGVPLPTVAPPEGLSRTVAEELAARERDQQDPHLRSAADVMGYGIQATDGSLGHVEDFLIDDASWTIRYLIVDPQNWWPGEHVVISTEWITGVRDDESTVVVDLTRDAVRNAPVYDPSIGVERDWETRLHKHFDRRAYWERPAESWRLRPPPK
jgi:hypothetical protein